MYKVTDGSYTKMYNALADAITEARLCAADEMWSGDVTVEDDDAQGDVQDRTIYRIFIDESRDGIVMEMTTESLHTYTHL